MRKMIVMNMLVFLSIVLTACAGTATSAAPDSSRPVNIAVRTDPDPAAMGDIELTLNITDAEGNPVEGATVDVSADHTDMTGMTMSGAAIDQGGGNYAINANFSMSGNWKLSVYVRKDQLDYREDIEFIVR